MAELTPMMQQYMKTKEEYKDCILFYRLGDFYEMFFDDALVASKELDITLTGKNCGLEERAPMCGVPFHAVDGYLNRLVSKGYKVAICEQMEDPALAKGLVKRDVIRIVTPGSVTESSMLVESKNNYYACVYGAAGTYGLCFCDVSTGAFSATQISGADAMQDVQNELGSFLPSEALLGGTAAEDETLADLLREKGCPAVTVSPAFTAGSATPHSRQRRPAASSSTTTVPQLPSAPADTTLPATGAATAAPCVQA
mgnify:CR=1 FL=1